MSTLNVTPIDIPELNDTGDLALEDLVERSATLDNALSMTRANEKALDKALRESNAMIQSHMEALGVTSMKTNRAAMVINPRTFTTASNWDDFWQYVHATQSGFLLQKRLSQKALEELLNSGEEVPGITTYEGTEFKFKVLD